VKRRHPLLLVAALGCAGCVLLDSHSLEVVPGGVAFVSRTPEGGAGTFRIEVSSPAREVEVAVDGAVAGRFATGKPLEVPMPSSAAGPGAHEVSVRELGLPSARTARLQAAFYPSAPSVVVVWPRPGEPAPDGPITLGVTFSQTLPRALVTAEHAWILADGVRLPARPRLAADGSTLQLDLGGPLSAHRRVEVVISRRMFGDEGEERVAWRAASIGLQVGVVSPIPNVDPPSSSYVVQVTAADVGTVVPPWLELRGGPLLIATLEGLPGKRTWQVPWETAAVPDGDYPLTVVAPAGFEVTYSSPPPTVRIDNVAPGLVACPTLATYASCVRPALDGPGFLGDVRMLLGGVTVEFYERHDGARCPRVDDGPWAEPLVPAAFGPAQMSGTARLEIETQTRSFLRRTVVCEQPLPPWAARWGDPVPGVLAAGDVVLLREETCVDGVCPEAPRDALLAMGTGAAAGKVQLWTRAASGWSAGPPLNRDPAAAASGLSGLYWLERAGGGPGLVRTFSADPLNLDPSAGATSLAASLYEPWVLTSDTAAWSEAAAQGRVVVVDGIELPRLASDAVADAPATVWPRGLLEGLEWERLVAWIETPPGGVARLRAARVPQLGPASILGGVDNLDPGVDARSPTVFGGYGVAVVAWLEGDRVIARVITPAGVEDAIPLGDPSRRARAPRLDPNGRAPVLYWIEETGAGDAIRVARRGASGWTLDPVPVNGPLLGEVPSFAVDTQRVSWVDGAGALHVRFANFPR